MKKVFKYIFVSSFACLILSSCVISKPTKNEEPQRTITVSGNGDVSVKPDLVSLKFLVKSTDWNVGKAVEKNATNSDFVFKALKDAGVDSSDISTADYQIYQDNSKDFPGQYTVKNTIAVIIRNTEITGKVIDAAVKSNTGANGLISFEYAVSDKSNAIRQARTLAIQNAQDAASLLAGVSGCKVSNVINISENYTTSRSNSDMLLLKAALSENAVSTNIEAGTVTISSYVTVTYELEK